MDNLIEVYVGLGANLGNCINTLCKVLMQLPTIPGIKSCKSSFFYRSQPVDADGPNFINSVAVITTELSPLSLLKIFQDLEKEYGPRNRTYRNSPRFLDLDLLLYGTEKICTDHLIVPHPQMHKRAFVLKPLSDLIKNLELVQGTIDMLLQSNSHQQIEKI